MDVSKQLDFDQQQKNIDSPGFQRREAAMQSRAALLRSSQSASLAGSMMSSLSFGASIGSSITASSQATIGETPLLLPGRPFRTTSGREHGYECTCGTSMLAALWALLPWVVLLEIA